MKIVSLKQVLLPFDKHR